MMFKTTLNTKFSGLVFPEHLSLGAIGGPVFMTEIVSINHGYEQRNICWEHARHRYDILPAINCKTDFDLITNFFCLHKGRGVGFAFKDWADYQVKHQRIGTTDGVTQNFQLFKEYRVGDVIDKRIIRLPISGTLEVKVGGQHYEYTVHHQTGVITFHTQLPESCDVTASFDFLVPVRFDHDELPVGSLGALDVSMQLRLIEIRI